MPKMKTRKAVTKKVRLTGRKKLRRRSTGQNHYNTRDTGKETRSKRRDQGFFGTDAANLKKALPYA